MRICRKLTQFCTSASFRQRTVSVLRCAGSEQGYDDWRPMLIAVPRDGRDVAVNPDIMATRIPKQRGRHECSRSLRQRWHQYSGRVRVTSLRRLRRVFRRLGPLPCDHCATASHVGFCTLPWRVDAVARQEIAPCRICQRRQKVYASATAKPEGRRLCRIAETPYLILNIAVATLNPSVLVYEREASAASVNRQIDVKAWLFSRAPKLGCSASAGNTRP